MIGKAELRRISPAEQPVQLPPGTERVFGVSRPLGNRLVWDIAGHAALGQLNAVFVQKQPP